jgi:hypothetical protein
MRSVLDNIKNWHTNEISSVSILLALRTLASLEKTPTIFQSIQKSGSLNKSLPILLNYLKINNKNKPIIFNNEEKLATLETIYMGIQIDIISIDQHQDLLQYLLKTAQTISTQNIESAILQFNGTLNLISIVDVEENITTQYEDDHQPTSSLPPNLVKPGPTYRATAIEKQTTTTNLIHTNSILEEQDWTSVPFKFSHNHNLSNASPAKITQLPLETTRTIPVIKARKEEKSTSNKLSKTNETIISETEKIK